MDSKGQTISKANYGYLNSSKKRKKLTILTINYLLAQNHGKVS